MVLVADDVAEWARVLGAASVAILDGPTTADGVVSLSCADPAGHVVQLRQFLEPGGLEPPISAADDLAVFRARLSEVGLAGGGGGGHTHNAEEEGHLVVWYGSHTGTAEGLATELVTKCGAPGPGGIGI